MSDLQQYPAWQFTIREAQAKQRKLNADAFERQAIAEMELEKKAGANLGYVLKLLGFNPYSIPTTNPFVHDGFEFQLKDWDSSGWEYRDHLPQFMKRGSDATADLEVKFTLFVGKEVPDGVEPEDFNVRRVEVVVDWRPVEGDWQREQARFADALDEAQANYDQWLASRKSSVVAAPHKPTLEEQFFSLFKQMVRKYQSHDDYDLDLARED